MATTLSSFSLEDDWQFSQGLVSEDYSYSHNTSHFTIFNAGSFEIDPRESDLRITLEGESEGNVTIFNKTTGDRFIYYPSLSTNLGQTLVLDGVYPVSYTHLRAHETDSYLVCRLLLEKKKNSYLVSRLLLEKQKKKK